MQKLTPKKCMINTMEENKYGIIETLSMIGIGGKQHENVFRAQWCKQSHSIGWRRFKGFCKKWILSQQPFNTISQCNTGSWNTRIKIEEQQNCKYNHFMTTDGLTIQGVMASIGINLFCSWYFLLCIRKSNFIQHNFKKISRYNSLVEIAHKSYKVWPRENWVLTYSNQQTAITR